MSVINKIRFSIIVVMTVAAMVSCKVTQPYQRPADADNRLYRDAYTTDSSNIASISWKDIFTDTLLQSLIQQGIDNNLDLQIAVARINSAAANLKQSKQQMLPNVNAQAITEYQRVPPTVFGYPQSYELAVNASWEADIWGQLSSAKRAYLATLLQTEAYKRAVQTQLISNIATNYYMLLAYDAQLRITEITVQNRKDEVETMKVLKESDVVTGAAVVQSEANRYSVEITIPDLKQNIRQTENAISILLGKNPDTVYRSTLSAQTINTNLKTGVPAQLLANRPDVQEAEFQLRNSYELINVARTYFYPTLSITASGGFSSTSVAQLFNPMTDFANIIGNLAQPIFNQGINKQRLTVAKAARDEYFADFKKSLLTAGQEVSDALYSYKSAVDKESIRTIQINFLQKSVDYTKELLKFSSATNYTDVLTSEQALLAAQLSGVSDKLQQLTAVVTLYASLGGGLK